jgi:hypothetical protein
VRKIEIKERKITEDRKTKFTASQNFVVSSLNPLMGTNIQILLDLEVCDASILTQLLCF